MKTSITLPKDLVKEMDKLLGRSGNRSALIEQALRYFLKARKRKVRDDRDAEILSSQAERLNDEALDVLSYQVDS